MTEEKVLQDEILSDEELEQVAGGTFGENEADMRFMRDVGIRKFDFSSDTTVRIWELKKAWADVGVVLVPGADDVRNEYYNSNGKEIPRADAYKIAAKKMKSKINYLGYLKCD